MRRVLALIAAVAMAVVLAGCSGSTDQATSATVTVTQPPETVTETVTATGEPIDTQTTEPTGEYPKIVSRAQIDERYVAYTDDAEFVMLAPGVYAEMPADGVLGTPSDYSSYFGECTAVNRYAEKYPGGSTCW